MQVSRQTALAAVALACSLPGIAEAQQTITPTPAPAPPQPENPASANEVLLKADLFTEDENFFVAEGNVEVRVEGRVLRADKLTWNREKQTMHASGRVQLSDSTSGSTQFADNIEVDEDFVSGFATRYAVRFADGSSAVAASAQRSGDGARHSLEQMVYTGCQVCKDENGGTPTWSLRARRAEQNAETKMITYEDVVLEVRGVPVLYVPWFAHPDPSTERRSGLLAPKVGSTSRIGVFYQQPYYWAISDSQDLTVAPLLSTKVNPLLGLDYRKRFFSGFVSAQGSVTYEKEFDSDGERFGKARWRNHLYASGVFDITDNWQWGFGVERQSDDLYDRRYDIRGEDDLRGLFSSQPRQLLSQIYATGQDADYYVEVGALTFQGLRAGDVDAQLPRVLPALYAEKVYDFGDLGRVSAKATTAILDRDDPQLLPGGAISMDSYRASAQADWRARYIWGPGIVLEPFAEARGDFYRLKDGVVSNDRQISRFLGYAGAQASMPFIRRGKSVDITIEPVVMVAYGTPDANGDGIPNEDSLAFEADESNLFEPNAVSNYDLWEGGARVAAGVSARANFRNGAEISALFGRRWREDSDPAFNVLSNLSGEKSDYVGSLRMNLGSAFSTGARVRMSDSGKINRIDMDVGAQVWRISGAARYFRVDQNATGLQDEGIAAGLNLKLTNSWRLLYNQQRNITARTDITQQIGVAYQDDCALFMITFERSNAVDRTLGPTDSINIQFQLKGLGGGITN